MYADADPSLYSHVSSFSSSPPSKLARFLDPRREIFVAYARALVWRCALRRPRLNSLSLHLLFRFPSRFPSVLGFAAVDGTLVSSLEFHGTGGISLRGAFLRWLVRSLEFRASIDWALVGYSDLVRKFVCSVVD